MTTNRRRLRRTAPALAAFAALALATLAAGDEIRLKSSIRLDADRTDVRLGDVATLDGEDARALSDVVLLDLAGRRPGRPIELPVARVRERLDDAGAHWGRVNLVGRMVVVRTARSNGSLSAMTTAVVGRPESATRNATRAAARTAGNDGTGSRDDHAVALRGRPATELVDAPTILGRIVRRMLTDLADPDVEAGAFVSAADLRIECDPSVRHLAEDDATDRRLDLVPETSWTSERVVVSVSELVNGRVEPLGQVAFAPLRRVSVPLAARTVDRGATFTPADLRVETRWMPPVLAALQADADAVVGRTSARRLREGEPVRLADAKAPVVVQKGDVVDVACHVGGLVITLAAEARESGAIGDRATFRRLGERTTFEARITGPATAERRF